MSRSFDVGHKDKIAQICLHEILRHKNANALLYFETTLRGGLYPYVLERWYTKNKIVVTLTAVILVHKCV